MAAIAGHRLYKGLASPTLFEVVIGLEIHSQVASTAKLFSQARVAPSLTTPPNASVALFDAAHPGTLPTPNLRCVQAGIATAAALHCRVQGASAFDRKHYYYADLPAGFQITQGGEGPGSAIALDGYMMVELPKAAAAEPGAGPANNTGRSPRPGSPAAAGSGPLQRRRGMNNNNGAQKQVAAFSSVASGSIATSGADAPSFRVRIERIQLEQDSGKSSHGLDGLEQATLVDLNRAGVGLLEIVTKPDLRTAQEAGIFLRRLHGLLRHIGVCEGAIEEGQLRCDVNVSVSPVDSRSGLPTAIPGGAPRVEMKNVASIRAVERAVECEAARQIALLEGRYEDAAALEFPPTATDSDHTPSRVIRRETRVYDALAHKTQVLRSKEGAADYRFLPEPDLLPLFISDEQVRTVEEAMPPLPEAIASKLVSLHGLSAYDASVLLKGDPQAPYYYDRCFKSACTAAGEPLSSEALLACSKAPLTPSNSTLSPLQQRLAKASVSWQCNELYGRLAALPASVSSAPSATTIGDSSDTTSLAECRISPEQLGQLVMGVVSGRISGLTGKKVLDLMVSQAYRHLVGVAEDMASDGSFILAASGKGGVDEGEAPLEIAARYGWLLEPEDEAALTSLCQKVIDDPSSATAIAKYKQGHERAAGSIVARVIKESGGKANPASVARIVGSILGPCQKPGGAQEQQPQLK
jgi:aspartyl-tRNA(Asn)/glutamyl-tRNA(Gln) amidotransferase subunit B